MNVFLTDNGDGDGWADTNETVDMRLTVHNGMGVDLTGLTARLTTEDPRIECITDAALKIGNLDNGEMRVTTDVFTFTVADVSRIAVGQEFSVAFAIEMSANEFESLPETEEVVLDLDFDVSGGSGPTTFFEGFENGFGTFTAMPLDEDLNPPDDDLDNHELGLLNADGYRCQYNDPDWEGSNTFDYSHADTCYPNPNGQPDAFWWSVTTDRSYSGTRSLYWGKFLDSSLGFTTPTAQLEALRTIEPISLGWSTVCSVSRGIGCTDEVDCPIGESCVPTTSHLTLKHQISQADHRLVWGGLDGLRGVDRAVLQVQLADDPLGRWTKLEAFLNGYATQDNDRFFNCSFDPIDDGNTEEDFFDPTDPMRRLGPSSTCDPERTFVHQGDTDDPFDPNNIGDAGEGPGLEGATGLGTWVEAKFDLQRYRARQIRIRLLESGIKLGGGRSALTWEAWLTFNPHPSDDGWFVDDVMITDTLNQPALVEVDPKDNLVIKADGDFDGVAAVCDCAPEDASAWAPPGEVEELRLFHSGGAAGVTTLTWSPPNDLGGTSVNYDPLVSSAPEGFGSEALTACLDTADPSAAQALDPVTPESGRVRYVLVRATHVCGGGPLGETSAGDPRVGVPCS